MLLHSITRLLDSYNLTDLRLTRLSTVLTTRLSNNSWTLVSGSYEALEEASHLILTSKSCSDEAILTMKALDDSPLCRYLNEA